MQRSAAEISSELIAGKRFLQQAEEMLTAQKRKALLRALIFVTLAGLWLTITNTTGRLTPGRRALVVSAGLLYVVAKSTAGIKNAKDYLTSSRRALAEVEAELTASLATKDPDPPRTSVSSAG